MIKKKKKSNKRTFPEDIGDIIIMVLLIQNIFLEKKENETMIE